MERPSLHLVTTCGLGHCRPFPGTWGSLPPPILAGVLMAMDLGPLASPWVYNTVLIATLLIFAWACVRDGDAAEARFGEKDPSEVVADETAGQCLPLLFLPWQAVATPALAAFTCVFAFLSFRVFDIVKPWPAGRLQRVPGGWGILLDDLFAGVYAAIAVQALCRLAPLPIVTH